MKKKHSSKDLRHPKTVKKMGHLGIVSVVCDQVDIAGIINRIIPPNPRMKITMGESVKFLILRLLGKHRHPLCGASRFFASKPIERLMGRIIRSEGINLRALLEGV